LEPEDGLRLGKSKPKALGGAPRTGKWTRDTPERRQLGGEYRAHLLVLLVVGALIVVGMGVFAVFAHSRLERGVLGQYRQSLRRPDWVRMNRLPPYVVDAFLSVVDTSSFQRLSPYGRADRPRLTVDLVSQVQRLRRRPADQAWRAFMVPLAEAQLSRRAMVEFYLNRTYLGQAGDWRVYGVQHAAEEYFGKEARRLSLSEAATLGEIDRAAFDQALREPLAFQPGIDYAPMTRPAEWGKEPEVIRLPPGLIPASDSSAAESR
jgi:hypothetical protein